MFVIVLYTIALFLLALSTLKTVIVNRNTFIFLTEKGHDPNIAHPQTAIRSVSWNFLLFNWFVAAATGNYLFG